MNTIEEILNNWGLLLLGTGAIVLFVLAYISLKIKKLTEKKKEFLFFGIVSATVVPTFFLAISTVYINTISSSGGPVHWHADIEIWNCGEELDLKDPVGLSNKIGTATLHEHNDKRIHVEGVVLENSHVSLGEFFRVIGGSLSRSALIVPTNTGDFALAPGGVCPDGQKKQPQLFVYKTTPDGYYYQQKIARPDLYVLSPQANVPAGDCLILEFGPHKDKTERICRSYKVAEEIGKLKGERK